MKATVSQTQEPETQEILKPEFCPHRECVNHDRQTAAANPNWYYKHGTHGSLVRGSIQRFKCRSCGKTCSTQTFSIHYWTHRTIDLKKLDQQTTSSSGQRQCAIALGASTNLVKNRTQRLARNYLALFAAALADFTIQEDCAFDGFESYLSSQYHPTNINLLVGSQSQAVYGITGTIMRRKGKMTDHQREFRAKIDTHWRPTPASLIESCELLFRDMQSHLPLELREDFGPWVLSTDKHKAYRVALQRVAELKDALKAGDIEHKRISSHRVRDTKNPLFAVNYIDRELRKDMADHVRETVKQPREMNMSMQRLIIEAGAHNFRKSHRVSGRIDTRGCPTHGDVSGLTVSEAARWQMSRLFTHRHVLSHLDKEEATGKPPQWIVDIWLQQYKNPPVVKFKSGEVSKLRVAGSAWCAKHLLV